MQLDGKIPVGALADKWDKYRFKAKLVNPANKRKYDIIVVGTGLAGGAAAATLAELGYNVKSFCIQDSPRRAQTGPNRPAPREHLAESRVGHRDLVPRATP